MTLDPPVSAFLAAQSPPKPLAETTIAELRAGLGGLVHLQGEALEVAEVRDVLVPAADGAAIPVRLYRPASRRDLPLVVYFHGGGWIRGDLALYDRPSRRLASASGAVVATVDYRLAPEHRFPVPLEDAYASVAWLADHAAELGIDPGRIVVAGDSAGGNLAAAVALLARERGGPSVAHQVLVYPALAPDFETASYAQYASGPLMTRAVMAYSYEQYLAAPEQRANPLVSPLAATSLAGLPPASIFVAENDPLRDDGLCFGERLIREGVPALLHRHPGLTHMALHMTGISPAARAFVAAIALRICEVTGLLDAV